MNPCLVTPIFFICNTILAYNYNALTYAILFGNLTITSIYYHSTYSLVSNIVDKLAILSVVGYGGYTFLQKLFTLTRLYDYFISLCILGTFALTNYLYFYGKKQKRMCFSEDLRQANLYHAYLHFVSAVGHALIILL